MRVVQFEIPGTGRRVGVVEEGSVKDVTALRPELQRVYDVFQAARTAGRRFADVLAELSRRSDLPAFPYDGLLAAPPDGRQPFLHPPVDHADPHYVRITGTGLTHTGSMQSRDQMHAEGQPAKKQGDPAEPQTDSARMFRMGLEGGRPAAGKRGVAPEWFYKGDGAVLRGHRGELVIPAFARDGGEEPEIVGCYIVDEAGVPRRLGFAVGNEWSDHATENINYLYLAPSKLRSCAVGPELNVGCDFQEVRLRCTVRRRGETIYDSGELLSGERHMCHSLANCEDHHFKYPAHRRPGDVHLHYFGTSRLSHSERDWSYEPGDAITIEAPGFSAPLINTVAAGEASLARPVVVEPA